MVFLLKTPSCAFSQIKQESLSELRERTGRAIKVKVKDTVGNNFEISGAEKQLLTRISVAAEQRNWQNAQSHFATYTGKATPIYNSAMNAALRCCRYEDGAQIYKKCRQNCELFEEQTFNVAMKIFAKLGQHEMVRRIWDEATKKCELSSMLVSSRIHAAASEGDVETAAAMLDLLDTNKLEINVVAISSAIRSCWGWGPKQHKAAKYLWKLFAKFNLKPDVEAFTTLIGAYSTAPLQDVLAAKAEMDTLEIAPNRVFAETFLASLLQQDFRHLRQVDEIVRVLTDMREQSADRLQAAEAALEGFETAGVDLTRLCSKLKRALVQLKQAPQGIQ
eukprot:Skav233337  [mRNA]  locus=scaffold394:117279:118280:+ [translate_table: standard]